MDDDWETPDPNYKPFSLIRDVSPEEEAAKDGFVDLDIYNHWKKAQRRLYQRLKAEKLAKKIYEEGQNEVDNISNLLDEMKVFTEGKDTIEPEMNRLIDGLKTLNLASNKVSKEKSSNCKK